MTAIALVETPKDRNSEIDQYVFMDFFLQVDSQRAVGTDNLVSANAGIAGDNPTRIRNMNVGRIIPNGMMCAADCGSAQTPQKFELLSFS